MAERVTWSKRQILVDFVEFCLWQIANGTALFWWEFLGGIQVVRIQIGVSLAQWQRSRMELGLPTVRKGELISGLAALDLARVEVTLMLTGYSRGQKRWTDDRALAIRLQQARTMGLDIWQEEICSLPLTKLGRRTPRRDLHKSTIRAGGKTKKSTST